MWDNLCGNNVLDAGEQCDSSAQGTAADQCVDSGTLTGNETLIGCTNCECTYCGDNILQNPPEVCSNSGDQANPAWTEVGPTTPMAYCTAPFEECEFCECVAVTCGNDILDPGEDCDMVGGVVQESCSANLQPNETYDGCNLATCMCMISSSTTSQPVCNNNNWEGPYHPINNPNGEECDKTDPTPPWPRQCALSGINLSGPSSLRDCDNCECVYCGDGEIRAGVEECDPHPSTPNNPAGCVCDPNTCTCDFPGGPCGDGITNGPIEECDDPGNIIQDCIDYSSYPPATPTPPECDNCTCYWCGDFIVKGTEHCDPPGSPCTTAAGVNGTCQSDCTCDPNQTSTCGNGHIDPGEDCDPPGDLKCLGGTVACLPNCTCPTVSGDCGDGVLQSPPEQCSVSGLAGSGDTEVDTATGGFKPCPAGKDCAFCQCFDTQPICRDGHLDSPPEECELGIPCPNAGDICTINCLCEPPTTGDCPPPCCDDCCCPPNCEDPPDEVVPIAQKACTITITGASTPAALENIRKMNAKAHDLFEGTTLANNDIFGEAEFSKATITWIMPDTGVVDPTTPMPNKLTLGNVAVEPVAIVQVKGQLPWDYLSKEVDPDNPDKLRFKKAVLDVAQQPTRLMPLALSEFSAMTLPKAMHNSLKATIVPDLSSGIDLGLGLGPVEVTSVVSAMGSENVKFSGSDGLWKLNNVVSVKLMPTMGTQKGTGPATAGTAITMQVLFMPDLAAFPALEGGAANVPENYFENRSFDQAKLLAAIENNMDAMGPNLTCRALMSDTYDPASTYQYVAYQEPLEKYGAVYGVPMGIAAGGAPSALKCDCDMSAAMPAASNMALMIGLGASAFGALIAVRRRRRR